MEIGTTFATRHSPPSFRLARDVVGHDAGEEIAALDVDEAHALEQGRELTRPIEMPDRIGEVADALAAFGRAAEELRREPHREPQIDQVRRLDDAGGGP